MTRLIPCCGLALLLAACASGDPAAVPEPAFVLGNGSAGRGTAVWSPDGSRIAYAEVVQGASAIIVADASGGAPVQLTSGIWDDRPTWSPDGQWIAYYSDEAADIYVVPSAGGERRQLTSGAAADEVAGWMPDGSGVIVERTGVGPVATFVAPLDGGLLQPLGSMPGAGVRAFPSPDGSRLLMQVERDGQSTIWIRDLPAGEPRQLTTEGFEDPLTPMAWSPDGRSVLYESRRTGTSDLWVLEVESGAQRQLTNDIRDDQFGRWSPDGNWVLFVSTRGGQSDLWVVPASGGNATRVTSDSHTEVEPGWAPDGSRILYTRILARSQLAVQNVGTGDVRTVADLPGSVLNVSFALSADGRRVAYAAGSPGSEDLWVASPDSGEAAPLVTGHGSDTQPSWSADGSTLAYVSTRNGTADIWLVQQDGGGARALTDWSPSTEWNPIWSPDGTRIAFLSNRGADDFEVWTMPVAGGDATRLTTVGRARAWAPAFGGGLAWSPDGQQLFFRGQVADGYAILAVPATGGTPRQITPAGAALSNPALSPDGRHIAYINFTAGWGFLEVVAAAGGSPQRLTSDTAQVYQTRPSWSHDGTQIVVEDWGFTSNMESLSLVTWPGGAWQKLAPSATARNLMPIWTRGDQAVLHYSADLEVRIVGVPVAGLLGPKR